MVQTRTRGRWLGFLAAVAGCLTAPSPAAESSSHWAYIRPTRPVLPKVVNVEWPRVPLDYFTLHDFEQSGGTPAQTSTKAGWLRRVTFDLTGLPPTLNELDAFLDDRGPNAYDRVVDRLLASPRFGEQMAVQWLDIARYADTHGYHADAHRDMWRWRDWVIQALNRNMPFDRFTIEQIAGDMLPDPTLDQLIATGFHRNGMINFEDGAIPEEYLTEYVAERVVTTSTAWLGQTMQCARCHDHKYDPFTQQDFFRMFAFFHNVPEKGLAGQHGNAAPFIKAPTRLQQADCSLLSDRIENLNDQLVKRAGEIGKALVAWEAEVKTGQVDLQGPPSDMVAYFPLDAVEDDKTIDAARGTSHPVNGDIFLVRGKFKSAPLFGGETSISVQDAPVFDPDSPFSVSLWMLPTTKDQMTILSARSDGAMDCRWMLLLKDGKLELLWSQKQDSQRPVASLSLRSKSSLALRKWQHLAVVGDGTGGAAGIRAYVDGAAQPLEIVTDGRLAKFQSTGALRIGKDLEQPGFRGMLDDIRLYRRSMNRAELQRLASGTPIGEIIAIPAGQRTAVQQNELRDFYLHNVDGQFRRLTRELQAARQRKRGIESSIPTTMIMRERNPPRQTFVLGGGNYSEKLEPVNADTPQVLPPMRSNWPKNRLGLARWLVSTENPLTARVVVNRYWQHYFGVGLVPTSEDFGTRGQSPTNSDLLDWLAVEFMASGWDVKRLHRMIVMSATYRAGIGRQNLAAEMVRDNALAVAGLLDARIGGKSVFPYQIAGLWRDVAYDPNELTAQVYRRSHGADLYRRGLYTFWKRAVPPPSMEIFGAPNREFCTVRRPCPNTPLQALVLMNDPTFIEASRAFAERIMLATESDQDRIEFAFRRLLCRAPDEVESRMIVGLLRTQTARFEASPKAADELLSIGESKRNLSLNAARHAAWTTVANMLLCLDEALTK